LILDDPGRMVALPAITGTRPRMDEHAVFAGKAARVSTVTLVEGEESLSSQFGEAFALVAAEPRHDHRRGNGPISARERQTRTEITGGRVTRAPAAVRVHGLSIMRRRAVLNDPRGCRFSSLNRCTPGGGGELQQRWRTANREVTVAAAISLVGNPG